MSGALVHDVHSRLNESEIDAVVPVDSLESIGTALDRARSAGPVSVARRPACDGRGSCSARTDSPGLVEGLGIDPRRAQALALTLLVPLSFLPSKRWAFRLRPDVA